MARRITSKNKAWLDAFFGEALHDATKASRLLGFKNPSQTGYRLKKKLADVIETRSKELATKASVSAMECLNILSEVARDPSHRDRVRAAEILSKIHGLQSERIQISQDRSTLIKDLESTLSAIASKMNSNITAAIDTSPAVTSN
jgi:hypothetical protein